MKKQYLLSSVRVKKTKKPYKCYGCLQSFEKGSSGYSLGYKINNSVTRQFLCLDCALKINQFGNGTKIFETLKPGDLK